jgi:hypothetical protein
MTAPIPPFDPLGLALPGPMLQALAALTLTLHFVAMQFTVGGSLMLLWAWRRHPGIARFFGTALPLGFSYLVTFGIPPLLFVQVVYGQFFYSSSVLVGAYWISVIPLILLGYGSAYGHRLTRESRPQYQRLVLLIIVLAVLSVGYIYVSNLTLSLHPERWLAHYEAHPAGGQLHHRESTLHPRLLLFLAPAPFAAGLALVLRAGSLRAKELTSEEAATSQRIGIRAMGLASLLSFAAVVGLLVTLPRFVTDALVTPGALSVLALAAAGLGLGALVVAWLSAGRPGIRLPLVAAHLFVGAVACLVVVRELVRQIYLAPYFQVARAPVIPQYGMAALFVLILVVGVVFLVVLTTQTVRGLGPSSASPATSPDEPG